MSDSKERPRRGGAARAGGRGTNDSEARRTERLAQNGDEWSTREPVNPGWRSERSTSRVAQRRRGALPASPQEFQIWLQAGGWRYAAGIGFLIIVLLIALMAMLRGNVREGTLPTEEPISGVGSDSGGVPGQQTLSPTAAAPTASPAPSVFVITGTEGVGANLRPQPSTQGDPLSTLPEGTRVEQIGEDVPGADFIWRKVRAPGGQEGYIASQFLTPAP